MPACRNSLRLAAAIAEHRAEIGEAGRLSGAGRGQIIPRHGDGEVGPQAQFLAGRIRRQVQAFADVLAGEVEERVGRLQDRRLGMDVAGLRKGLQQGIRPSGGWGGAAVTFIEVVQIAGKAVPTGV